MASSTLRLQEEAMQAWHQFSDAHAQSPGEVAGGEGAQNPLRFCHVKFRNFTKGRRPCRKVYDFTWQNRRQILSATRPPKKSVC